MYFSFYIFLDLIEFQYLLNIINLISFIKSSIKLVIFYFENFLGIFFLSSSLSIFCDI